MYQDIYYYAAPKGFEEKPKSLNIIKSLEFEGVLSGVKGQYLIFEDDTVFNVRSNEGIVVELDVVG